MRRAISASSGGVELERGRAVLDRMRVNAGDGRDIGGCGGADGDGHAPQHASKNKTPRHKAGALN